MGKDKINRLLCLAFDFEKVEADQIENEKRKHIENEGNDKG